MVIGVTDADEHEHPANTSMKSMVSRHGERSVLEISACSPAITFVDPALSPNDSCSTNSGTMSANPIAIRNDA
jgi:hypothetical protein